MRPPESLTQRRAFLGGAAVTFLAVAGCASTDNGVSDDPAADTDDTDVTDATDDGNGTDDGVSGDDTDDGTIPDDTADDSATDDTPQLIVEEGYSSYTSETWVERVEPDGEVLIHSIYLEVDIENERVYQRQEISMNEEDPIVIEYYRIGSEAFQVHPDGNCTSFDADLVDFHLTEFGGLNAPDPDHIDVDEEPHVTYDGTKNIGVSDTGEEVTVHVWTFDMEETVQFTDGRLEMYVDVNTGYLIGYDGWYPEGAADDPAEITFTQRNARFNQELSIEVPTACEE